MCFAELSSDFDVKYARSNVSMLFFVCCFSSDECVSTS